MRNVASLLIALLLVGISLAGCAQGTVAPTEVATEVATSTPEAPSAKAAADLEGKLWKLDSYLNSQGESVGVRPGTKVTIEFKDGQIGGSAGCNTYFGSYEVEGDSLTIGPIGVTEMFCVAPENVMEQESAYLAALQSAASYQVTDDQLQMANTDGETVLSFSVLEPESLTGTTWRLTVYNNGQGGFVSLLRGTEITALFGDDGNLSGSAGCNRYTASYEVDGETISVGPAAATRMMCAKPEGIMEQESAHLSMLESAAAYQIRGDTLKMRDSDGEHLLSYTAETEIGMANPASVYCKEQGGRLEIRTADDGGQYGVCIFPDGSECEEWAFFRGECVPASASSLSLEALKNATYPSEWEESGAITLTDGRYEGEPFVEGGASRPVVILVEPVVFGDLDGDGVEDAAVILAANAGGSGTFISLEAVRNEEGEPVHVATYSLGDRARIESLAIEGGQILLEMITHGPDDPLCCPTQLVRNVYALEGDTLIEVSSEVIGAVEEPSKPTAPLTLEALQNASYQGIYDEPVQLTDGRYEGEPFVPGGASRPTVVLHPEVYAFGDLNGNGVDDAVVILIENSGGSGNFRYLAAVINEGGAPMNVATQFVGDREQVQAISVDGNEITLDIVTHGPDDPLCCPTQLVRNVYALEGDALIEVSSEVIGAVEELSKPTAQLTLEALQNATYPSEWGESGAITLTDGRYEGKPFVEGGASRPVVTLVEPVAFGDLDGNGIEDAAVILAANAGGSGTFISLEAVRNEDGAPAHVATYSLGDRARIESLAIEGGQILLEMITHGPDDPLCCPTQQVVQTYALQEGELVQTSSEVISPGPAANTDIVGTVWNWQRFSAPAGQNDIVVIYPPAYRLELLPDGQFNIKADCNLGSGGYTLEGSSLTLQLGPMTLAECGPSSQYDEYIGLLGQVAAYERKGDTLILNLMADAEDSGSMTFSKLYAVTGRIIAPAEATLPEKAQVEVKVMDVTQGTPGTQMGGVLQDVTQFPIEFEATYYPPAVQPDNTYILEITIKDKDGNPLFTNTQVYPVLTQGNPTYHIEVMVEQVGEQAEEATQVIEYRPAMPEEEREGSCWTTSLTVPRADAWRCMVDSGIFDPCFALEDGEVIVCGANPVTGEAGFKLNLTEPLPESELPAEPTNNAWLIELADGTICGFATGATGAVDEKRINYLCADPEQDVVILGDLQPGEVWMAEKAIVSFNEGVFSAEESEIVAISTVWK